MKVVITWNDPEAFERSADEMISEMIQQNEKKCEDEGDNWVRDLVMSEMEKVPFGEQISIEFDTETGTYSILK